MERRDRQAAPRGTLPAPVAMVAASRPEAYAAGLLPGVPAGFLVMQ
ncbi:hypothetical protein GXW71_20505 [Roseomonas hellenica]|uniref:Uncharacterized protein n=1 Tax=Plastoroseomonas hellenica TaxID=2687306 RepID=A0ABS5F2D0_9PROT|nr:hypothetical protein [Plastoroseomonas hellenica]MBR0666753.1 hypothetical protein [Plastoroseomonas hellenica]